MTTSELKAKLQKSLDFLQSELNQIRTGRANPSLVEDVTVSAYDSKMTIKEVGSVSLLDSQTLVISPWDKTLVPAIVKAIIESKLNLVPQEDGQVVRVPIPPLTEDRRIELTKVVSQKVEDSKQSLRSIRQDAMKDIEKSFTAKEISEDQKFTDKDSVEKIVKEFVEKAEEIGESKRTDLMRV